MLEGVEHDQGFPSAEPPDQNVLETGVGFDCANRLGKLGRDQRRVLQLAQRDEKNAVRPRALDSPGNLHGKTCLADAAWPSEGEQPHIAPEKGRLDGFELLGSAEKRGENGRQPRRRGGWCLFVLIATSKHSKPTALLFAQPECGYEPPSCVLMDERAQTAFHVTHGASADACSLRELLLRHAGSVAQALKRGA